MPILFRLIAVLGLAATLGACSDNDDDSPPAEQPPPPPPTPGTLIENPPARIASLTPAQLFDALQLSSAGEQILDLIIAPTCGVDVHQLRYHTVDPAGAATTASGALMIPTGSAATCQGARPMVVYTHGTAAEKSYNIADLSNADNAEGLLIAATFAAHGYIVVAPNYAGYDSSTLTYHPYLHAEQQSKDTVDALSAARSALPTSFAPTITNGGKLFVTGYSQGGYVAMATHRLLQQTGSVVTASAPMSGPYALAAFGDAIFQGQVIDSAPLLVSWIVSAYQRIYGNLYAAPTDAFDARYATGIDTLLPTTGTRSQLYDQGRLPREQLFNSTPPDPAYAAFTPATTPADLAPVFARGFGPDALVTNTYRLSYLQDSLARPDGAFPAYTDGLPAAAPTHPLRIGLKANDLRNWLPTAPVLLCAGNEDPSVLYMNTDLMQRYWSASGVTAPLRVLDVDSDPSLDDPYAALKVGFATLKATVELAEGEAAVAEIYHSTLVPPFCLSAVQSFFDGL